MNILFVYTSPIIPENGGVQRVTEVLKNYFKEKGINSYYLTVKKDESIKVDTDYFFPNKNKINDEKNLKYYIQLIKEKKIDIVINQAALGGTLNDFCVKAKGITDVKLISVIHNSLLANAINFVEVHDIQNKILVKLLKTKLLKFILLKLYVWKYKKKYENMCKNSDKVILLSSKFEDELKYFTNCCKNNLTWISNPLTIEKENNDFIEKENILLYVGRLDTKQKKVNYLLDIWSKLHHKYPEWELAILGDGEEKEYLEELSQKLNLERVTFYGKQNPTSYYKKAKILCMTSAFEGFPLVLAEAQLFGTVPIAFNSFSALEDVIQDGENGRVVKAFEFEKYENLLSQLIEDQAYLHELSKNCKSSVDRFSLEQIGNIWIEMMNKLIKEK